MWHADIRESIYYMVLLPQLTNLLVYFSPNEIMAYLTRHAIENKSVLGGGAAAHERQRDSETSLGEFYCIGSSLDYSSEGFCLYRISNVLDMVRAIHYKSCVVCTYVNCFMRTFRAGKCAATVSCLP